MPMEEYRFHATMTVAAGGLVLSGDDLGTLPPDRLEMLQKLLPPTGVSAEFEDAGLRTGTVRLRDRTLLCLFNWDAAPAKRTVTLPGAGKVTDLWSGREYPRAQGIVEVELKGHEGTVLVVGGR
jgi:alpha-galactosidase